MDHRLLTDALASAPRELTAGRCFEASNQSLAVPQFHVTSASYLLCSFDCLSVVCTHYKRVALDMTFVVEDVHSIIGHAILSPGFISAYEQSGAATPHTASMGYKYPTAPVNRSSIIRMDFDCPSLSWLEREGHGPSRKSGYGNELLTAIRSISQQSRCSPQLPKQFAGSRIDPTCDGTGLSAPLNGQ
jgi:hypothetical protein